MESERIRPLTVGIEAAKAITGISRSSLYEAIGRGELDAVKDGDRLLITMTSIERRQAALPRAKIKPTKVRKHRKAVSA